MCQPGLPQRAPPVRADADGQGAAGLRAGFVQDLFRLDGRTAVIEHDGAGLFAGLPQPFLATRYHSLIVERETIPPVLEISATTSDGLVMGLRHRDFFCEGVQFHPESIMTAAGKQLLGNFLKLN